MQVKLRLLRSARNLLRGSCVSKARNAGKTFLEAAHATLCGDRGLRKSRGKCSFWKSSVSVFEKASRKMLVLEVFLISLGAAASG